MPLLTDLWKILNAKMNFPKLSPLGLLTSSRQGYFFAGLLAFHPLIFNVRGGLAAFENLGQGPQSHNEISSQKGYSPACLPRWLDIGSSYYDQAWILYTPPRYRHLPGISPYMPLRPDNRRHTSWLELGPGLV